MIRNRRVVSQKPKFARSPELRVNSWVCSKESTGGLNETAFVEWLGDIKRTGRSRDSSLGGHKHNLVHTKTQRKGTVTPQETERKLPAIVASSPVEA